MIKVGSRVRYTGRSGSEKELLLNGYEGICIETIYENVSCVGIEWDKFMDGYDLHGTGKNGHCWNTMLDTLELIIEDWDI
jgi:hypothetical protein